AWAVIKIATDEKKALKSHSIQYLPIIASSVYLASNIIADSVFHSAFPSLDGCMQFLYGPIMNPQNP
ncbi:hypothetical protein ALC60_09544, partial [Trachymyrmex zeteki]